MGQSGQRVVVAPEHRRVPVAAERDPDHADVTAIEVTPLATEEGGGLHREAGVRGYQKTGQLGQLDAAQRERDQRDTRVVEAGADGGQQPAGGGRPDGGGGPRPVPGGRGAGGTQPPPPTPSR